MSKLAPTSETTARGGAFLIGLLAAPLFITGWYRLTIEWPYSWAWFLPPYLILLGISPLLIRRTRYRFLGIGLLAGSICWAMVLGFLIVAMSRGPAIP